MFIHIKKTENVLSVKQKKRWINWLVNNAVQQMQIILILSTVYAVSVIQNPCYRRNKWVG